MRAWRADPLFFAPTQIGFRGHAECSEVVVRSVMAQMSRQADRADRQAGQTGTNVPGSTWPYFFTRFHG